MVAQYRRPNVENRSLSSIVSDDLATTPFSIDRELTREGTRALFVGQQRGVARPVLIERMEDVAASQMVNQACTFPLEHVGIAQPIDAFVTNDALYTIMAAGNGAPLGKHAPLSQSNMIACGIDLASALSYLIQHRHALPARALTPGRVFFTDSHRSRLIALGDLLLADLAAPVDETALVYHLAWMLCSCGDDRSPAVQAVLDRAREPISTCRFISVSEFRRALLPFQ